MEFKADIKDISTDWKTGKINITFQTDQKSILNESDQLKDAPLKVTANKYREKRSLDSNSYCWVLLQKIAEAVNSDKWSVYMKMLKRYSRSFTHIIVKEEAVERVKTLYRECIDLGEITVNGKKGHQLQVYFGSSTFDTKEMSVFIDGIVSECKELGIETLPPYKIEQMKSEWDR